MWLETQNSRVRCDESGKSSRLWTWWGFVSLPPFWEGIPGHPAVSGRKEQNTRVNKCQLGWKRAPEPPGTFQPALFLEKWEIWLGGSGCGSGSGHALAQSVCCSPSQHQTWQAGRHRAPLRTGVLPVRLPSAARTAFAAASKQAGGLIRPNQQRCKPHACGFASPQKKAEKGPGREGGGGKRRRRYEDPRGCEIDVIRQGKGGGPRGCVM